MTALNPIPMPGMEGHNLLGFLAALGVLYELDQETPGEVRLSWQAVRSTWTPVIWHQCATGEELVELLVKRLCTGPRRIPNVMLKKDDL